MVMYSRSKDCFKNFYRPIRKLHSLEIPNKDDYAIQLATHFKTVNNTELFKWTIDFLKLN